MKINNKQYLRFGEIPLNEKSKIHHRGDIIGEEIGVSCYDIFYNEKMNIYQIILPPLFTNSCIDTLLSFIQINNKKIFIISGDEIGRGRDNEPLIINTIIIKEIDMTDISKI